MCCTSRTLLLRPLCVLLPYDRCVRILLGDAPAIDVWVDGTKVLDGIEFTQGAECLAAPDCDYNIVVTPAGGDVSQAVIDPNVTVEGGMNYTVAAVSTLDSIEPQVVDDDASMPAEGTARVRTMTSEIDASPGSLSRASPSRLVPWWTSICLRTPTT